MFVREKARERDRERERETERGNEFYLRQTGKQKDVGLFLLLSSLVTQGGEGVFKAHPERQH